MEKVNLAEIVVAAVNVAKPMLMSKGHLLVVSMPGGRIMLNGNRSRIEQVLTNLLTNAAKYTRSGGCIILTVEPAAGAVVVRVRDNGIGIPPTLLPYVFDCYQRGTSAHGDLAGGLGIGLALVKSLVELHGGTVSAYSDGHGKGSEFAIQLPSGVTDAQLL
jgi:signal transduction histidine kinase